MSATLPKPSATTNAYCREAVRCGDLLAEITALLNGWPGEGGSLKIPADCLHADTVDVATVARIANLLDGVAAELRN